MKFYMLIKLHFESCTLSNRITMLMMTTDINSYLQTMLDKIDSRHSIWKITTLHPSAVSKTLKCYTLEIDKIPVLKYARQFM